MNSDANSSKFSRPSTSGYRVYPYAGLSFAHESIIFCGAATSCASSNRSCVFVSFLNFLITNDLKAFSAACCKKKNSCFPLFSFYVKTCCIKIFLRLNKPFFIFIHVGKRILKLIKLLFTHFFCLLPAKLVIISFYRVTTN